MHLPDGHASRAAALVALDGEDLVVVGTEVQAVVAPSIDVVLERDSTAGALVLTDAPVLVKRLGAVDRWRVVARAHVDVVRAAVRLEVALVLRLRARVECAERLEDVVLDERVGAPAVDGQVRVAARVVRAGEVDGPAVGAWVPTLATNEVANVAPLDAVSTRIGYAKQKLRYQSLLSVKM